MSLRRPVTLPNGHIATNEGEIAAHGFHADLVAGIVDPVIGSHQVRYARDGSMIDEQFNFRGGGHIGIDASGNPIKGHNY